MRLIVSPSTDVYFNLAAEAYFLQQTDENICMLWQSANAVVCGKHQNICAEINYAACHKLNILPARRISGGGTVYHDLGNVNFTFVQDLGTTLDKAINYKRFLEPIRNALSNLGVDTSYSDRDDLLYNDIKISGNAQHIFQQKKRVLHHGTLLINANIHNLSEALKSQGEYIDKAVKSNRSQVTNLAEHFPKLGDVNQTIQLLQTFLEKSLPAEKSEITAIESDEIIKLRNEKFCLNEWILGYSPNYIHKREINILHQSYLIKMVVNKGVISEFSISSKTTSHSALKSEWHNECDLVINKRIQPDTFENAFRGTIFGELDIINQFF